MSHVSVYKTIIKDVPLLCNLANDLYSYKVREESHSVNFWGRLNTKAIASIHIKGWKYPIAITKEGEIHYDHFGSEPNTMSKLGTLLQEYCVSLITNKIPTDKVKSFYSTKTKDTGDYLLTLEF